MVYFTVSELQLAAVKINQGLPPQTEMEKLSQDSMVRLRMLILQRDTTGMVLF